jgi:uncharacterized protein
MHIIYLHGFASSAHSTKARFFAERLAPFGVTVHGPDFNEPDFATLTVTRMIDQVDALIATLAPGPVVLVGSSLGAFVAWHAAARREAAAAGAGTHVPVNGLTAGAAIAHPISKLILLAPALDFGANRLQDLGDEGLAEWKRTDALEVFHYAYDEPRIVRYGLHDDALRYDSWRATVQAPSLAIQGSRDTVVRPESVERFAAAHPHMTLRMVDDEHQLGQSLELIWHESARFLGLPDSPPASTTPTEG